MKQLNCVLRMESHHASSLDAAVQMIRESVSKAGLEANNEVSLPMKRKVFTVLRSPHIDKKSREQFEIRTYTKSVLVKGSEEGVVYKFLDTLKGEMNQDVSFKVKFICHEDF